VTAPVSVSNPEGHEAAALGAGMGMGVRHPTARDVMGAVNFLLQRKVGSHRACHSTGPPAIVRDMTPPLLPFPRQRWTRVEPNGIPGEATLRPPNGGQPIPATKGAVCRYLQENPGVFEEYLRAQGEAPAFSLPRPPTKSPLPLPPALPTPVDMDVDGLPPVVPPVPPPANPEVEEAVAGGVGGRGRRPSGKDAAGAVRFLLEEKVGVVPCRARVRSCGQS
jgi:hypothetical protein